MSDTSILSGAKGTPKPTFGTVSQISGSVDPDISIDEGQPVTPDPANPGTIFYARANTELNAGVIGLAFFAGEAGNRIVYQWAGPLSLSTAQWDRVTGGSGGLQTGASYYVSQAAGGLLTTDPSGTTFTAYVGRALSPTTLLIMPAPPFATSP